MAAQCIIAESGASRHDAVSAAVLAGGESRRMGSDKRYLEIGSQSLLARMTDLLRRISDDVLVSCRDARQVPDAVLRTLGARRVVDVLPGSGPLGGIASALRAAVHAHVIVVAVDMPFVSAGLLRLLARRAADGREAVVVRSPRGLEPMLAAYPRIDALAAEALLLSGERRMSAFLDAIPHCVIEPAEWTALDPSGDSFVNWNRPEDVAPVLRASTTAGHGRHARG